MKRISLHGLCLVSLTFALAGFSTGQVATGTPAFSSSGGGPFDVVNLGNLNVHLTVPILHRAGRGMPFSADLGYDSSIWTPTMVGGVLTWVPSPTFGWITQTQVEWGYLSVTVASPTPPPPCYPPSNMSPNYFTVYSGWTYVDRQGVIHSFGNVQTVVGGGGCSTTPPQPTLSGVAAIDGSGYILNANGGSATVTTRDGRVLTVPINTTSGTASAQDANGNEITINSSGQFVDTLGQVAPNNVMTWTGSGTPASPTTFTYPSPGGQGTYTMNYGSYNVMTNFSCGGGEYNQTGKSLLNNITLPDGTQYIFTYEATPGNPGHVTGRLATVTLPTGGTITYGYNYSDGHNGIICADGSTDGFTRTLNPGGAVWNYTRSQISGNNWQTTVTTPASDNTVIDFQKDSATDSTNNFYETQRQTYQGAVSSANLLQTTVTCYNTNNSNCTTTAVSSPISQVAATLQYPNNGQQSETVTSYNGNGLVTAVYQYAYGTGAPGGLLQNTQIGYASLGNGIVDHPSLISVYDGSNHLTSQTSYAYDEYSTYPLQTTTGTPNHIGVTGSRGNATTVTNYVTSSAGLTRHFSYFDTGNVYQSYDVNGAFTTYNYADANSTCGNSFPTSVSLPVNSLSTSTTWNCIGGVATQSKDANLQPTTVTYNDPYYWRPAASTDPLGNQTISYYQPNSTSSVFEVAHWMVFNNNSVVSDFQFLDSFGRTYLDQASQYPSSPSVDSVSYSFDSMGRPYSTSLPCSATYGATCSSAQTTQTYDALNRPKVTTDGGGGTVTYTYNQNDVLQARGPAPAAENVKQKQLEYDSLGRLTSVCEVTQGAGYVACSQSQAANGYLTTYAYDYDTTSGRNRVTVTQNAQTRTYLYDLMGRLVSEKNPETNNAATTYTYDSSAAECTAWGYTTPYPGDLVEKDDANGNASCFLYDGLHRLLATYFFGPNTTPSNHFVYDAASVNGTNMSNARGRLAEAFTCVAGASNCAGSNLLTDEDFSYSVRGELTDLYESTPHSGGYYHTTASYWANGALNTLGGVPGQTAWTYGVDGEGRLSTAVQGSTNLVSSVTYNQASQPRIISFGVDSDNYTYDTNTGRMTNYTFTVGTAPKSLIGNLTWNANGTLRQLQITDQFNAGGTQTCNYGTASTAGYDDLGRLLSADCGASTWQQNFSYDVFGNLTKTTGGSFSWNPGYNQATNRYTLSGTSYDSNGNLLNDTFHTHTWDAENHPVKIGSTCGTSSTVCVTYDAFGKIVEKQSGSAYKEILYSPIGKTAVMNGQTLVNAYVPLPGGATLNETPGAKDLWHKDWLGSARLSSTLTGHTIFYDRAFAPFGEQYSTFGSANSGLSFTGDTQDTFIVNGSTPEPYDTANRELHPIQGRWLSPDPAGRRAADPTRPQTWNRYAYVENNPLSYVDPDGTTEDITGWLNGWGDSHGGGGSLADAFVASIAANSRGGFTSVDSVLNNPLDSSLYNPFEYSSGGIPFATWDAYANWLTDNAASANSGGGSNDSEGNGSFTKAVLPEGPYTNLCQSGQVSFLAPASFDLSAVVAAGKAGGLSPSAAIAAEGEGGTFDYQRSSNAAGDTIFYSGYTNVANFGVGAYLYGAGFTQYGANMVANAYAFVKSSNAGNPNQALYQNAGYQAAASGGQVTCSRFPWGP